jgi:hypothetical protein
MARSGALSVVVVTRSLPAALALAAACMLDCRRSSTTSDQRPLAGPVRAASPSDRGRGSASRDAAPRPSARDAAAASRPEPDAGPLAGATSADAAPRADSTARDDAPVGRYACSGGGDDGLYHDEPCWIERHGQQLVFSGLFFRRAPLKRTATGWMLSVRKDGLRYRAHLKPIRGCDLGATILVDGDPQLSICMHRGRRTRF